MTAALLLVASALAGMVLGWLFYQGLWWTIRQGLASPHPAAWFLLSLVVRMGVVVVGVIVVAQGDWRRLLACVAGFVLARILVSWAVRARQLAAVQPGGPR